MIKRSSAWLGAGEWLLNRRWWLAGLSSLSVFTFEFLEYQPHLQGISSNFFFEILFYGVVLPLSMGIALSWAAASRSELAWSIYYQNLIPNLSLQMHHAHTYDELASVFLQFVRVVVPLIGITIYKYEQADHSHKTVLNWSLNNNLSLPDSNFACATDTCPFLTVVDSTNSAIALEICRDPNAVALSKTPSSFCLPFLFSDALAGGARLHLPSDTTLSPEQIRLLKEVAPVTASTFHRIELEQRIKKRDHSIYIEQQRVARDVHDTLGHSLAYLRLRLDQISMELNKTNALQHEVESLRDVAKEAYDQMRGILTMLSPDHNSNLDNVLMSYTDKISRQVNFQIKFHRHGQPRTLPAHIQRNVFYVFQESLTNIEKHAHAKQVDVELSWHEKSVEIKVTDDGIGYDPALLVPNGHFGLNNMRERAQESNTQLSVSSQPGQGTCLTLNIPYEDEA